MKRTFVMAALCSLCPLSRNRCIHERERIVDLVLGRIAAKADTDGGSRLRTGKAQRRQHMAGTARSARAGRSGRKGSTPHVRDQPRGVHPRQQQVEIAPIAGIGAAVQPPLAADRSEEHTSELQSLMRISYAVFCLKKKKT